MNCQAHDQVPLGAQEFLQLTAEDAGNILCYGPLFICSGCGQSVCSGYGTSDDMPDHCDRCWNEAHPLDIAENLVFDLHTQTPVR